MLDSPLNSVLLSLAKNLILLYSGLPVLAILLPEASTFQGENV